MTLKKNSTLSVSLQQYSHSTLSVTESSRTAHDDNARGAVMAERSQQSDATNAPYFGNIMETNKRKSKRLRGIKRHQTSSKCSVYLNAQQQNLQYLYFLRSTLHQKICKFSGWTRIS
jgi:hypothetical protein